MDFSLFQSFSDFVEKVLRSWTVIEALLVSFKWST